MRKHLIIYVCVTLSLLNKDAITLFAQDSLLKPIPYSYVREADAMWSKRIWRVIDLREKINFPLYYPLEDMAPRKSLFRIIQNGIYSGEISNVYEYDVFTNEFGMSLPPIDAKRTMTETIDVKDSVGNLKMDSFGNSITIQDTIQPDRIAQYWIQEEWFFDKQLSVMDVRIIGIAPVIEIEDPAKDKFLYKPLFWLSYANCRNYFSKFRCYNPYNDSDWRTFDEVFRKRIFGSYIRQESNVYNRPITSYAQGSEALFESERIKEDIFKFEENLWHH